MNFSSRFINKPIMASVISIMIFLAGFVAIFQLPISEYPEVSPPSVKVNASFPGANPKVVSETVAAPLEEQINGVEHMLYMNSLASTDGSLSLTVTFAIGTDPDLAQQLVQNRVSQALPRLPAITQSLGVTVTKSSPDMTMIVNVVSPDKSYDALYLRNYSTLNIKDELAKISGVGSVSIFGSGDYAMRVWLNPEKISERGMSPTDVISAIQAQNVQVSAGTIGGPPYANGVEIQMPVNMQGRLQTVEEFENIIIKHNQDGVTRLKDVARIELDAQSYSLRSLLGNDPAVGIAVFASPGANALDIASAVIDKMEQAGKLMPKGVEYKIEYNPTVFVSDSISAVIKTLIEALLLVVLVIVIFLQKWRASLIPLLAVPVSIIGTFAIMYLFGFSINVLTLFGLILSVGIVVDDSIVVVENVERNIRAGKKPKEATMIAMKEVTGPIIATFLVLAAIFIPISFVSGLTGMFYKQFALTIAIAVFISTICSLTLSPALAALLLQENDAKKDKLTLVIDKIFGRFFNWFNNMFHKARDIYSNLIKTFIKYRLIMMGIFVGLVLLAYQMFTVVPSGFVPAQDKGYLIAFAQLSSGSTLNQTEKVIKKMGDIALKESGVKNTVQFSGLSINGFVNLPNTGIAFIVLDEFEKRKTPDLNSFAIAGKLQQKYSGITEAYVAVFPAPSVRGLGTTGGFKLQIEDRSNQGFEALDAVVQSVMGKAYQNPKLTGVFSSYNINSPQLLANIDRTKAQQLGIPVEEIFNTMQIYLGSKYVNDFNLFGKTYQVVAQADEKYRSKADDISSLQVQNSLGQAIPLGAFTDVQETFGPDISMRYNAYRAADLSGNASAGVSSGQAQDEITKILNETLPSGMTFEWTDLTYQQVLAGNTAIFIFPLCLLLVFLILAAQYESLTMPLAVILIIPAAILSALFGIYITGGDNNIFTQIALFVLAGLASKNAILIVEFARELEHQGKTVLQAAIEASRLRLRPILMTSFAFIMGVYPLAVATGAGAEMRQAIGIAVFSGMLGVTFFGLIFTPVFYYILRTFELKLKKSKPEENTENLDK
jgi:multidrug efflux pump